MAKVQTRRSISLSRPIYDRLKEYCDKNGVSMSQVVEERIKEALFEALARAHK